MSGMLGNAGLNIEESKLKMMNSILKRILKKITPDKNILGIIDRQVEILNRLLAEKHIGAECVKGGSVAKDTFLKDDFDADLFIRFDLDYKDKDISNIVEDILNRLHHPIERIHGSRDYFHFVNKKINYEIVPVLKVHPSNVSSAQNVTDLSPEHVFWVKKHTDKNPVLKNEIRIAKQFCKANEVYGAESYIKGFSGHIIDILVIYFGSFIKLITAFSSIKNVSLNHPIIIDPENHQSDPLQDLNSSKLSPLIIIDPIQKDRNAAAALSQEKLMTFMSACKNFLENPSDKYFVTQKFDLRKSISFSKKTLKRNNKEKFKILIMKITALSGSKDVVGTKILKVYEDIIKQLTLSNFNVLISNWHFDFEKKKAEIFLILPKNGLSEYYEQEGPPLSSKLDCNNFYDKHMKHKTLIRNDRLYAIVPRKYPQPEDFLQDLFKKDFIKSRIQKITLVKTAE